MRTVSLPSYPDTGFAVGESLAGTGGFKLAQNLPKYSNRPGYPAV